MTIPRGAELSEGPWHQWAQAFLFIQYTIYLKQAHKNAREDCTLFLCSLFSSRWEPILASYSRCATTGCLFILTCCVLIHIQDFSILDITDLK